ncbi:hypothetical protein [Pleomorphomonas sp. T1.2MG-36]|uniref:hypothetical protein n=1 Tax=Pleomorphomonas sp. T1.2MG-36 TaxID=3041167 RepID=UPI002541F26E|nr:hypothetical protein [Pleomorphomonas sp. T1.2MG-36]
MTCLDPPMIRRGSWRASILSILPLLAGLGFSLRRWRTGKIEDLNEHMLRDIGFTGGRATEAGMRERAERRCEFDRF